MNVQLTICRNDVRNHVNKQDSGGSFPKSHPELKADRSQCDSVPNKVLGKCKSTALGISCYVMILSYIWLE